MHKIKSCVFIIICIFTLTYYLKDRAQLTNFEGEEKNIKLVKVVNVKIQDIQQTVQLIGTVKPKSIITLTAKSSGILNFLISPGQRVSKGTCIARLNNNQLYKNYIFSLDKMNLLKAQLERSLKLRKLKNISQNMVEDKRRAWIEAQQSFLKADIELNKENLYAPFEGIIGIFKIMEGAYVQEGDKISTFYDPTSLIVDFQIPASIVSLICEGQSAKINDKIYKLNYCQKMIDEETHMIPSYVENFICENCIIGTNLDIEIILQEKKSVIVIPNDSIFIQDNKTYVYIIDDNKVTLRAVKIGIQNKENVEICSGLQKGDKIISQNQRHLYPGMFVKIDSQKFL